MTKIKVTKTMPGSPDGLRVLKYTKGEEYDVPSPDMSEELANVFLEQEWAVEVVPEMEVPENKLLAPPEQKEEKKPQKK